MYSSGRLYTIYEDIMNIIDVSYVLHISNKKSDEDRPSEPKMLRQKRTLMRPPCGCLRVSLVVQVWFRGWLRGLSPPRDDAVLYRVDVYWKKHRPSEPKTLRPSAEMRTNNTPVGLDIHPAPQTLKPTPKIPTSNPRTLPSVIPPARYTSCRVQSHP